jgi:hypothetical protein
VLIGMALEKYRLKNGTLPPPITVNDKGVPMHSWRTLILPFLGEESLFGQYHLGEPWDGPHNKGLIPKMPSVYRCPWATPGEASVNYVAVIGPDAAWGETPREPRDRLAGVKLLVVEVADSGIAWTEPRDMRTEDALRGVNKKGKLSISSHHVEGAMALHENGEVEFLSDDISDAELRSLLLGRAAGTPEQKHQ